MKNENLNILIFHLHVATKTGEVRSSQDVDKRRV